MDSKGSSNQARCSFERARDALRSCYETLRSKKPDFAYVFSVLQPYEACDGLVGGMPKHSAAAMATIQATLGDCYRENHNYEKAAELYRKAGNHRPIMGFDEIYAGMVLQQGMREHYGPALDCLRAARDDSRKVPILKRVEFFWRNTLSLKFQNPFRRRRLIRELSRLTDS